MNNFKEEVKKNIELIGNNNKLHKLSNDWLITANSQKYSYNFTWLGRPIIQYPQDIMALQEIIWQTKPDLIIETGIAHGGSLILSASILELLGGNGKVLGIDIDIREHNRREIEQHPLYKRINMIEGSSVDIQIINKVKDFAAKYNKIMLILDSNHSHDHVLAELNNYSSLVSKGCYLVVFDTVIENMPADAFPDRHWGPGDNPFSAVIAFLKKNDSFIVDKEIENKLQISVAPNGYLKRIKLNE